MLRLDKFLKVSRIIKRRTVAKELCAAGKVLVNYRPAKASTEVKEGDILTIDRKLVLIEVEVLAVPDRVSASQAKDIYRLIKREKRDPGSLL